MLECSAVRLSGILHSFRIFKCYCLLSEHTHVNTHKHDLGCCFLLFCLFAWLMEVGVEQVDGPLLRCLFLFGSNRWQLIVWFIAVNKQLCNCLFGQGVPHLLPYMAAGIGSSCWMGGGFVTPQLLVFHWAYVQSFLHVEICGDFKDSCIFQCSFHVWLKTWRSVTLPMTDNKLATTLLERFGSQGTLW